MLKHFYRNLTVIIALTLACSAFSLAQEEGPPDGEPRWQEKLSPEEFKRLERQMRKIRNKFEIDYARARIYVEKRQPEKALELFRKILDMEVPDGPFKREVLDQKIHVFNMMMEIAMRENMDGEVMKWIDSALEKHGSDPGFAVHLYLHRSKILQKNGKLDEALKDLETADKLNEQLRN